ncbi:MAG: NrdH-redoxin [bacterium]|nr:NrdH-redoxin [bacterium]
MAKDFFTKNNIQYTDRDIAIDPTAGPEAIQKSGQMGVPVIDIDGKIVTGFDESQLRKLLEIK